MYEKKSFTTKSTRFQKANKKNDNINFVFDEERR